MLDNFAIFILTHGRPHNQRTLSTLRTQGFTGKIYLVVDDEDKTLNEYKEEYGDCVLVFNKEHYIQKTDTGLKEPLRNFAVFARNAIEDFAKQFDLKYFGMFDDDILKFRFRYIENDKLLSESVTDLDTVIGTYIDYMECCNLACTGFGVATQYIGGLQRFNQRSPVNNSLRLCYNAYIRCSTFNVDWLLNMCEDRITSILHNTRGQIWQQLLFVQIDTSPLYGKIDGGNSSVYRMLDEFTQVFFPIVSNPNTNFISTYNDHLVTHISGEDNLCPKIIGGKYKNGTI